MISIGAYYLCYLRKKENKYYKKITWLDNWYHRFFYNINMSFIITECIIVTLYGFSIALIVKVVVSKNIYFLFLQVIKYCSVPDVSINKLSTFIGNHVRHRILPDHHHFE